MFSNILQTHNAQEQMRSELDAVKLRLEEQTAAMEIVLTVTRKRVKTEEANATKAKKALLEERKRWELERTNWELERVWITERTD